MPFGSSVEIFGDIFGLTVNQTTMIFGDILMQDLEN